MKNFKRIAAQGDLLLIAVDNIPKGYAKKLPVNNSHIVAHSETGHHHIVSAQTTNYYTGEDTMEAYLEVEVPTEIKHLREFDMHESIMIPPGIFQLRRQREYTPEGWRRVED